MQSIRKQARSGTTLFKKEIGKKYIVQLNRLIPCLLYKRGKKTIIFPSLNPGTALMKEPTLGKWSALGGNAW